MIRRLENQGTSQPGTMQFARTARDPWRFLRDVPTVSYHALTRCPSSIRPEPPRHQHSVQPDHSRPDRAVCERLGRPGRASDADTRHPVFVWPLPRHFEPAAEGEASLHKGADEAADRLGWEVSLGGLPLPRRRGCRKGACQAATVGEFDLLVCQKAQGLRVAPRDSAMVQREQSVVHPSRLPPVADQAVVRPERLPNQAQAGGGHIQGRCRFGAASQMRRLRHALRRWVVHQVRSKAGGYLDGNIAHSNERRLARSETISHQVVPRVASRTKFRGSLCNVAQ
jgi:hypothetical protein